MSNKKTCPDCNNRLDIEEQNGYTQCGKCYQMVLIEAGEPIKAIPVQLFNK